jgi:hypothetical protein
VGRGDPVGARHSPGNPAARRALRLRFRHGACFPPRRGHPRVRRARGSAGRAARAGVPGAGKREGDVRHGLFLPALHGKRRRAVAQPSPHHCRVGPGQRTRVRAGRIGLRRGGRRSVAPR